MNAQNRAVRSWEIWFRWTLATTVGELVGFAVPSAVGAVAGATIGEPGTLAAKAGFAALMIASGLGEGAILGFAQSLALKRYLERLRRSAWALATAVAAGVAWTIGMLPSTFVDLSRTAPALLIGGGTVLGVVFILSIGFAQWLVLRHHVERAGWWILANAVAWPAGVSVPFIALSLVPDKSPIAVWVTVGVLSGILMGLVVGAVTGIALVHLLRPKV